MWNPSNPQSIERLQIVYKIAERCNLNCTYCYYYHMGDETAFHRPPRASLITTTALADWLVQGCQELEIPQVNIAFHGGEPMLLPAIDFARACDVLIRKVSPVAELSLSIQTNGTLMTKGWFEALKQYKVNIGVSIDGVRVDHDRFRLDHKGKSSFDKTESTIKALIEASEAYPHLSPGTISVMHHEVDYKETYNYLRELGVRSMHFLLPDRSIDHQTCNFEDESKLIGKGLLDIFEAWMTEDNPSIKVRFINEKLGHFQMGGSQVPIKKRRKSNQILIARSDQTIAIDDSLIPALDWYKTVPEFPIAQYTLRDVFRNPIFQLLESEQNCLPDGCAGCQWTQICGGGDLENRYSKHRGFNNPSVYCGVYKTLYQGICEFLIENGYPKPEIELRFGNVEYV